MQPISSYGQRKVVRIGDRRHVYSREANLKAKRRGAVGYCAVSQTEGSFTQ
jgi:hypothetical protein